MAEATRRDALWANVGRAGALLGVLLALGNLYGFLRPAEPRLAARCQTLDLQIAYFGNLKPQREQLEQALSKESVAKMFTEHALRPASKTGDINKIAEEVATKLRIASLPLVGSVDDDASRVVGVCEVQNTGKREAKDVQLAFPFELAAARIADDDAGERLKVKTLALGSIRPGISVNVTIVSDAHAFGSWNEEAYVVSHADGSRRVSLATPVYGTTASIVAFLRIIGGEPFLAVMLTIMVMTWAIPFAKRKFQNTQLPQQQSRPPGDPAVAATVEQTDGGRESKEAG